MDWKYKHFNHQAIFRASRQRVLEAARQVVAESLGRVEDTADGFVAQGYAALHPSTATVRLTSAVDGTHLAVELLVQRAAARGYMLWDIGGYYNGRIDKWFSGIAQHLGDSQEQVLVSKTTAALKGANAFRVGCFVYVVVGVCLAALAVPLSSALRPQSPESIQGPLAAAGSVIGLLAGIGAFLHRMYPDASASKFIRTRLHRTQDKE
jgi:hypothetical protein